MPPKRNIKKARELDELLNPRRPKKRGFEWYYDIVNEYFERHTMKAIANTHDRVQLAMWMQDMQIEDIKHAFGAYDYYFNEMGKHKKH